MKQFKDIEAVILDKDGVFVDFHKLWLRVIAYRAQLIAETTSNTSDELTKIRTNCIRAMGIDEDLEAIDPYGPCSLPYDGIMIALTTALFITKNEISPSFTWSQAYSITTECVEKVRDTLKVVELSEPIEGSIEKITELNKAGFKMGIYTSDTKINADETLKKFGIAKFFKAVQAGEMKTQANYEHLCAQLKVEPSKTLLLTDSPVDLHAAKAAGASTIAVLSGVIDRSANLKNFKHLADGVIDSIAEFDLAKIKNSKKKQVV